MRNMLFIDIDGVLHPVSVREIEIGAGGGLRFSGPELFRWAPVLWQLIEPYDVMVAVHSSWRHSYQFAEILDAFPAAMQSRIAGLTAGAGRYESILDWVERYEVTRFAVLDDTPGAFPMNWPHLIDCDPELGITESRVQERLQRFLGFCERDEQ